MLQHPLYHTTSVRMSGQRGDLTGECAEDELDVFWRNALNGFLDHMIAVLVLHAAYDVVL